MTEASLKPWNRRFRRRGEVADNKFAAFNRHDLLSTPIGDDGKRTLGDFLADNYDYSDVERQIEDLARKQIIDATLSESEKLIWEARHPGRRVPWTSITAIDTNPADEKPETFDELGKKFGVTGEAIRQRLDIAEKKLREAAMRRDVVRASAPFLWPASPRWNRVGVDKPWGWQPTPPLAEFEGDYAVLPAKMPSSQLRWEIGWDIPVSEAELAHIMDEHARPIKPDWWVYKRPPRRPFKVDQLFTLNAPSFRKDPETGLLKYVGEPKYPCRHATAEERAAYQPQLPPLVLTPPYGVTGNLIGLAEFLRAVRNEVIENWYSDKDEAAAKCWRVLRAILGLKDKDLEGGGHLTTSDITTGGAAVAGVQWPPLAGYPSRQLRLMRAAGEFRSIGGGCGVAVLKRDFENSPTPLYRTTNALHAKEEGLSSYSAMAADGSTGWSAAAPAYGYDESSGPKVNPVALREAPLSLPNPKTVGVDKDGWPRAVAVPTQDGWKRIGTSDVYVRHGAPPRKLKRTRRKKSVRYEKGLMVYPEGSRRAKVAYGKMPKSAYGGSLYLTPRSYPWSIAIEDLAQHRGSVPFVETQERELSLAA